MVINPPWNLPFLGAKGLTSPEQTATVEMVFSRPWTCTFLVAKGLTTLELMANWIFKDCQINVQLHKKKVKFDWGDKEEAAFHLLKEKPCAHQSLALPEGDENFIVYCDALHNGLGVVLMQNEKFKKCLSDEPLEIPLDELHIDDKLYFIEEPVEIMDREVKRLNQSVSPLSKFDGTLGEVLSSHGNVKINFERSIHISSQNHEPLDKCCVLEPCGASLL
ncbi:putative reverse transcriptase domain-containing protein [Tanacetum coccineum]